MTQPPLALRPVSFATRPPTVAMPMKSRTEHSAPILVKDAFQQHAHGVLEYLLGTLCKTW
jgi:hypothetical protein